jgi:hypothetical protein
MALLSSAVVFALVNWWQREMAGFFVQRDGVLPDRAPDQAMDPLEEVFHLSPTAPDSARS